MRENRKLTIDGTTYKVKGVKTELERGFTLLAVDAIGNKYSLVYLPEEESQIEHSVELEEIHSVELPMLLAIESSGKNHVYQFDRINQF